jgi:basic membrane lipoprotein Med (substrate-binding protein (PBP1-ABC) superfamily)
LFVDNYDNGDGEEIEYGCNNRVTDLLSLEQVRKNLPKELKTLTDDEIIKIQEKLEEELISGGCGWCV